MGPHHVLAVPRVYATVVVALAIVVAFLSSPAAAERRTNATFCISGDAWAALLRDRYADVEAAARADLAGAFQVPAASVLVRRLGLGSLLVEADVAHSEERAPGAAVWNMTLGNITAVYRRERSGQNLAVIAVSTLDLGPVVQASRAPPAPAPGLLSSCATACVVIVAACVSGIVATVVGAMVFVLTRSSSKGGRSSSGTVAAADDPAEAASLVPDRFSVTKRMSLSSEASAACGSSRRNRSDARRHHELDLHDGGHMLPHAVNSDGSRRRVQFSSCDVVIRFDADAAVQGAIPDLPPSEVSAPHVGQSRRRRVRAPSPVPASPLALPLTTSDDEDAAAEAQPDDALVPTVVAGDGHGAP